MSTSRNVILFRNTLQITHVLLLLTSYFFPGLIDIFTERSCFIHSSDETYLLKTRQYVTTFLFQSDLSVSQSLINSWTPAGIRNRENLHLHCIVPPRVRQNRITSRRLCDFLGWRKPGRSTTTFYVHVCVACVI